MQFTKRFFCEWTRLRFSFDLAHEQQGQERQEQHQCLGAERRGSFADTKKTKRTFMV